MDLQTFWLLTHWLTDWLTHSHVRSLEGPSPLKNYENKPQNTHELRKKNKKKIGSNAKNLRKLEPQPEQTFLIKKKCNCLNGKGVRGDGDNFPI